jgi:hypothetical protein
VRGVLFAALFVLAACGKVGDPRPPIIRVTTRVDNLSGAQNGYKVFLSWTNPAKYVDGNPATDTGVVHIFLNGAEIAAVPATSAGQPQSFPVDVTKDVNNPLSFTIQLVVPRANKPSPISNAVTVTPVDVPGTPGPIVPIVDQGKIVLTWAPPVVRGDLAQAYLVQRSDRPAPLRVPLARFEDSDFEVGKSYDYTVTAVRGTDPQIPGDGSVAATVLAKDETSPKAPAGLQIQLLASTAFLQWEQNSETDLKEYHVFRSDRPNVPIAVVVANAFGDPDYEPGKGISYEVLAVDDSGNPSKRSAPRAGP